MVYDQIVLRDFNYNDTDHDMEKVYGDVIAAVVSSPSLSTCTIDVANAAVVEAIIKRAGDIAMRGRPRRQREVEIVLDLSVWYSGNNGPAPTAEAHTAMADRLDECNSAYNGLKWNWIYPDTMDLGTT